MGKETLHSSHHLSMRLAAMPRSGPFLIEDDIGRVGGEANPAGGKTFGHAVPRLCASAPCFTHTVPATPSISTKPQHQFNALDHNRRLHGVDHAD
jgi:hypothetical protein